MAVDAICFDSWARRDAYAGRKLAVESLEPSNPLHPFLEPLQSALSNSSQDQSAAIIWSAVHGKRFDSNGSWLSYALAGCKQSFGCSTVVPSVVDSDSAVAVSDTSVDILLRAEQLQQPVLTTTPPAKARSRNSLPQCEASPTSAVSTQNCSDTAIDVEEPDVPRGSGARAETGEFALPRYNSAVGTESANHFDGITALSRRRSAGILRKGSVQVVQTRPRSKSVPSRRRSVHFSDSKGLPLVQAKEPDDWPCLEDTRTSPQRSRRNFELARCEALGNLSFTKSTRCNRAWKLEGVQPADCADFELRLTRQHVCLERAEITRTGRLHGIVQVMNLTFCKTIFIRLSVDGWRSFIDVAAAYCGSQQGRFDRFAFGHTLDVCANEGAHTSKQVSRCEFAVCYRFLDTERWDNNNTKNYALTFER